VDQQASRGFRAQQDACDQDHESGFRLPGDHETWSVIVPIEPIVPTSVRLSEKQVAAAHEWWVRRDAWFSVARAQLWRCSLVSPKYVEDQTYVEWGSGEPGVKYPHRIVTFIHSQMIPFGFPIYPSGFILEVV
jgi:hypothetical protein